MHARKRIEMEGRVFGRLVVVDLAGTDAKGHRTFECLCECGNTSTVLGASLRAGRVQSCGCLKATSNKARATTPEWLASRMRAQQALLAAAWERDRMCTFGQLTPVDRFMRDGQTWWRCSCNCGGERIARAADVRHGSTTSCGCRQKAVRDQIKAAEGRSIDLFRARHGLQKPMHIVIVGCSSSKLPHPAPAGDLYTSQLFRMASTWAKANGDRWMILSALHGLIDPTLEVVPYDVKLSSLTHEQRTDWDAKVATTARDVIEQSPGCRFTLLAGRAYAGWVTPDLPARVAQPLYGLEIGQRLQWFKRQAHEPALAAAA